MSAEDPEDKNINMSVENENQPRELYVPEQSSSLLDFEVKTEKQITDEQEAAVVSAQLRAQQVESEKKRKIDLENKLRKDKVDQVVTKPFLPSLIFNTRAELKKIQDMNRDGIIEDIAFDQLILTHAAANDSHLDDTQLNHRLVSVTFNKNPRIKEENNNWKELSLSLKAQLSPEGDKNTDSQQDEILQQTINKIDKFVRYSSGVNSLWYSEAKEVLEDLSTNPAYQTPNITSADRGQLRHDLKERMEKLTREVDTKGIDQRVELIMRDIDKLPGINSQNREQLLKRVESIQRAIDRIDPTQSVRSPKDAEKYEGIAEDYYTAKKADINVELEPFTHVPEYSLWGDAQYTNVFQQNERFNRSTMPRINKEGKDRRNWPTYYEQMSPVEQSEIDARRELVNGTFYKRFNGGGTLEQLSKNESMKGLSTEETKRLYKIPGVKDALKVYLELFENNERLFTHTIKGEEKEYSIREATTNDEVALYREVVQRRVRDAVVSGYSLRGKLPDSQSADFEDAVKAYSVDAEQVAFNLHYLGNTFESADSVWDNGIRIIKPSAPSECVQPAIRAAMKPLDGLVYLTLTDYKGTESVSKWANSCVIEEKKKLGIEKLSDYDEVVIVGENSSEQADKYWKVEQLPGGKTRLYAPEARPVKLVGSMWEETKANDRALIDYIRNGEDIPWDSSEITQKVWDDYASRLDKAHKLLSFFKGEKRINFSSEGREFTWAFEASSALTDFKLADKTNYKRWIVYHSVGINLNPETNMSVKLMSMLKGTRDRKPRLVQQYRTATRTVLKASNFGGDELFFPWDSQPFMERGV